MLRRLGTLHIEDKYVQMYIISTCVYILRYAFGDDIDRSQMHCGLLYLDHQIYVKIIDLRDHKQRLQNIDICHKKHTPNVKYVLLECTLIQRS